MDKNKISICITYYNQKEFVRDSLDSVLAIDFPYDYEILVGDDGSSDGTVEIVNEYINKYPDKIKVFIMDRNENSKSIGRASLNRLNLVQNATGDFIMFLDGDDFYCDKEFVKDALKVFEDNEKVVACAFNHKMLFENNKEQQCVPNLKDGFISIKKYIKDKYYTHYIHCGAFMFKNIFLNNKNKINYLRGIGGIFDDNGITLYFLQFGDLYYINRDIYVYRQNSNSLWNRCSLLEQNVINAIFFKPLLDVCPKYKFDIIKRYYGNIKYVWKNRKQITDYLTKEHYEKYCTVAKQHKDSFMLDMLNWKTINILKQIKCFLKKKYYSFVNKYF